MLVFLMVRLFPFHWFLKAIFLSIPLASNPLLVLTLRRTFSAALLVPGGENILIESSTVLNSIANR